MLSHQTIIKSKGSLFDIVPFYTDNVNAASYDLTLGNTFIVPEVEYENSLFLRVRTMNRSYKTKQYIEDNFIVRPKMFVLATTREIVSLSPAVSAFVDGRSSIGRLGLQMQNAGFIDPGFTGRITLEIFNASDVPVMLEAGRRVCQLTFFLLDEPTDTPYGDQKHTAKYMGQTDTTDSRIFFDSEIEK